MKQRSDEMEKASLKQADKLGRPVQYINDPSLRKEDVAKEIARRDGIEEGLVCVLTAVEVCNSFDIQRNRDKKILDLVPRRRKCLHLYHYFQHPQLGLMHLRLQTWFPFTIWSCINGRHWLCRQLDQAGVGYRRRENCLLEVADLEQAQRLADTQVNCDFAALLDPLADLVHPLRRTLFENYPMDYYWSCQDSEFASDIMFKSEAKLSRLYRDLIRHGTQNLSCNAVMRFLGRKACDGEVYRGNFKGQVVTDSVPRPRGDSSQAQRQWQLDQDVQQAGRRASDRNNDRAATRLQSVSRHRGTAAEKGMAKDAQRGGGPSAAGGSVKAGQRALRLDAGSDPTHRTAQRGCRTIVPDRVFRRIQHQAAHSIRCRQEGRIAAGDS